MNNSSSSSQSQPEDSIYTMAAELAVGEIDRIEPVARPTENVAAINWSLPEVWEELQTAEEELRQQNLNLEEERLKYQDLFNFAPDGYLVTTPLGVIESANQKIGQQLGMAPHLLVGKPLVVFIAPADCSLFYDYLNRRWEPNQSETGEITIKPRHELAFTAEFTIAPIYDRSNTVTGLRWLIRDITDRQQAQTRLKDSEQRYLSLAETVPVGIFRTDAVGNSTYVNNFWCEISGLSPEAAAGNGWISALHPEDREQVAAEWYRLAQENSQFQMEYRFLRSDGKVTWVYGQAAAQRDADGQIIGYAGTLTDIRDRKQAEIQLELQNTLLAKVANNEPLVNILNATISAVEKILHGAICSVLLLDRENRLRCGAAPNLPPEYNQNIEGMAIGDGEGSCGTAAFRNQTIIVTNISTDPLWQNYKEYALQYGLQACWSSPINSSTNQVLGTFAVYHKETRSPQPHEIKSIDQLANILGIAIERKQAEQQLQTLIEGTAATTGGNYFPALVSHIADALNVSHAVVTEKIDDQLSVLAFWANGSLQSTRLSYSIPQTPCELVLQHGKYCCESLVQEKFPADLDLVEIGAQSYLGIALKDVQGNEIGNLCILDHKPIKDPQKTENLLRVFAARAAAELERERADRALERLNQELEQRVEERTAQLQKSEHRYRALMDGASDAIILADDRGYLIEGNQAVEKLLGYSRDELIRLHMSDLHPPAALAAARSHFQTVITTETAPILESIVLRKDGSEVAVDITASRIEVDGVEIAQGIFRDITERKQMEVKLAESEAKFRRLVEDGKDVVWALDKDSFFTYLSPQFKSLFGWEAEEWIGKSMPLLVHPEDLPSIVANAQNIKAGKKSNHHEFRHLHRDGHYLWVRVSVSPILNSTGEVTGAHGILTDISEKKQIEFQLAESEAKFRRLVEGGKDLIWSIDQEGLFTYLSPQFKSLCGWQPDEWIGKSFVDIVHPTDLALLGAEQQKIYAGQKSGNPEFRTRHRDGHYIWTSVSGSLMLDSVGAVMGLQGILTDVTDRKQAEIALELEALRRNTIFNASCDGIHILDIEGNLIEANDRFAQMLGYTPTEIVGFTVFDWDAQWSPEELADVLKNDSLDNSIFETLHRRKDGSIFPVEISRQLMVWQGKSFLVNISRDISERQQAAAALQASEAELQSLFMGMDDVVFVLDRAGTHLKIAPTNPAKLYRPSDILLGRQVHEFFSPAQTEYFVGKIALALDTQQTQECEYSLTIDNIEYWFNARCSPLDDRTVIWVARDITAQQAALRDRQRAEIALQESQRFIERIADASPNILYLYDLQAERNVYVNREIYIVLGYTPAEIQAMGDNLFANLIHPEDLLLIPAEYARIEAGQDGDIFEFEYRMKRSNGEWCWLLSRNSIFSRDLQGCVLQMIGTAQDITERKAVLIERQEYQSRLEHSNAELLRATRLKDEFLANMSHELRTPLNAILGLSESFLAEVFGAVNERQKKAISTVERSGQHLLSLINDILEVSKIEAGKLELEMTTVSATTLTNSTLAFVKQLAHQKQIQLTTSYAPNLGNIEVDERRIRQVLINLLNNAVKFTPTGGQVKLEVQLEQAEFCLLPTSTDLREQLDSGAWILFAVTDTGIGITPENQSKLFKPFVQIDGSLNRQYQGTGLGLTLVKQIVELHGGSVMLTSEFGQGSCFTVRLPYYAATQQQVIPSPESNPSLSIIDSDRSIVDVSPIKYPLILLVEDNQDNINTLCSYLEASNYRLTIASNGHEAISILEGHLHTPADLPDLILMDIQMPGIDGLETMQRIRLHPQLADLPIIALTALAMEGDSPGERLRQREKCLAAGANDYLTKPIKLKQLRETIQSLIPAN